MPPKKRKTPCTGRSTREQRAGSALAATAPGAQVLSGLTAAPAASPAAVLTASPAAAPDAAPASPATGPTPAHAWLQQFRIVIAEHHMYRIDLFKRQATESSALIRRLEAETRACSYMVAFEQSEIQNNLLNDLAEEHRKERDALRKDFAETSKNFKNLRNGLTRVCPQFTSRSDAIERTAAPAPAPAAAGLLSASAEPRERN